MLPYWPRAHQWAKQQARAWHPVKAIPSVFGLVCQALFDLQPSMRALAITGTVIGGYVLAYACHYLLNLFVWAPPALDSDLQQKIKALEPAIDSLEESRRAMVSESLLRFSNGGRMLLRYLLNRGGAEYGFYPGFKGEISYEDATQQVLIGEEEGLIVPRRQGGRSYISINPDLKDALEFCLRP